MAETLNLGTDGNWAVEKDSLLAYNSENNNFKPLAFDFTRASNATVVNKAGLIETVGSREPRIDFLGNTKGALKLEPQRTNLLQYSEDFTSTEWTKTRVSTPIADSISPDGSLNGYSVTNNATGNCLLFDNEIGASLLDSTFSVFFKYKDLQYVSLRIDSPTDTALFDILNGSIVGSDTTINPRIENYGNGWYRCSITHEALTSAGNAIIMWNESGVLNNNAMASTNVGYYIYAAQYEIGSYATSYIPTSGQNGGVTRVADNSSLTPPDGIISLTEGTFYVEYPNIDNTFAYIALSQSGNYVNRMLIGGSGNNRLIAEFKQSGTIKLSGITSAIQGVVKAALSYSPTGSVFYVNGTQIATGTSSAFGVLNEVELNSSSQVGCKLNQIKNYNTRLSNAELIALTTI
jgi:hypothetical protein